MSSIPYLFLRHFRRCALPPFDRFPLCLPRRCLPLPLDLLNLLPLDLIPRGSNVNNELSFKIAKFTYQSFQIVMSGDRQIHDPIKCFKYCDEW